MCRMATSFSTHAQVTTPMRKCVPRDIQFAQVSDRRMVGKDGQVTRDTPDPAIGSVAAMRRPYAPDRPASSRPTSPAHWLAQFERWFADAVAAGLPEPNAMIVATADAPGRPSARTVLLKAFDAARLLVLHQLHVAQGHRARRQPVREPGLPVVRRCTARWSSCGAVERVDRADDRGLLRQPAARVAARRVGKPTVAGGRRPCRRWTPPWMMRATERVRRTSSRSRRRRTGVGCGYARRPSSSGRAGPAGCTIDCGTADRRRRRWIVERLAP